MLLLFLALVACVCAQYPFLLQKSDVTLGQCLLDSDCAIFEAQTPGLLAQGLHCEDSTSRCELSDGTVIGPNFDITCAYFNMSMNIPIVYGSARQGGSTFAKNYRNDGIIRVDLNFPDSTQYQGILRLYLVQPQVFPQVTTEVPINNVSSYWNYGSNTNSFLIEQKMVNSPEKTFYFRNLQATRTPATMTRYNLAYFDSSGCMLYRENIVLPIFGVSSLSLFGVALPALSPSPAPVTLASFTSFVDPSRRIAYFRAGVGYNFLAGLQSEPLTGPFRCIYGQVIDMNGRVLSSKIDEELSGSYGNPNNGLWYPPFDPSSSVPPLGLSNESYSKLGGYVRLQLGIGYCYNSIINATKHRTILQDALGVFEGFVCQSIRLDLNTNLTTIPLFPMFPYGLLRYDTQFNTTVGLYASFDGALMYRRLNDIMLNTYLWPKTTLFENPFGSAFPLYPPVDFTRTPIIRVSDDPSLFNSNSMCHFDGASTIYYDYSGLRMSDRYPNQVPSLFLYIVNTSSINLTTTLVDQRAPFILPGTFTVYTPGMYCLDVWHDLLDGLLYRLFLRSCFQVGTLAAAATQLDSYFVVSALNPFPTTSLPYAGYGSYVFTNIYLSLPQMLVVPKGMNGKSNPLPRVRFLRYSIDPDEEQQIRTYGATNLSVYKSDFSVLNILSDYIVVYDGSLYTSYFLNVSNYNKLNYYSIAYNGGGQVISETLIVAMEMYTVMNDTDLDNVTPEITEYNCPTKVDFQYIASPEIQNAIEIGDSVCPGTYVDVRTHSRGGFCMDIVNPFLETATGNPAPFQEPCTYFQDYYNIDDPTIPPIFLYGTQNAFQYAAPPGVRLKVVAHDIMGVIAETEFKIVSLIADNATTINFKPPAPYCDIDGVQRVVYEFFLTGTVNVVINNVTVDAIYGWEPLNVLAQAAYNPNSPFFDLPSECALLTNGTMTPQQVYLHCHRVNTTIFPECEGCTQLPVVYENTNGTQLYVGPETTIDWWDAYVWVPTIYVSPVTNRTVYCRFASSIYTSVPSPMFLIVTNLRRIQRNGQQCLGLINCFAIDIDIFMDPVFEPYYPLSGIQLTSIPAFGSLVNASAMEPYPLTNASHIVTLEQEYQFTLDYDNFFCPVTQTFLSSADGQVIPLVRTTHSVCSSPTGSAVIYMNYVDVNLNIGTVVRQCMFWQGYSYQSLGPFFNFEIGANVNIPLLLPYSPAFAIPPNETRFYGVSAGLQRFVVYDQCEGTYPCPPVLPDCVDFVDQTTLQVTGQRNSLIYEFSVAQFNAPGGGIVIALDNSVYAQCYGDTYYFTFSVYDDKGEDTGQTPQEQYGPYYATIIEPITGQVIYETTPQCIYDNYAQKWTGGIPLQTSGDPPTLEQVGYKVRVFTIETFIRTGEEFGFRQSGNFTFVVRNCASGCIQTFVLDIAMVNPFDIILSAVPAQCSSGKFGLGSIIKSFGGGTPFLPGELLNSPFYYADYDTTLHYAEYITCWLTPLNPTNYVCTNLGIKNPSGNYTLKLIDKNNCTAIRNVTVPGAPPFKVEIAGVDATCSTSDVSTVTFVVTEPGNGPPYYTGQALTNVTFGTNITYQFVNSFGTTLCYTLLDSKFCEYSTQLCTYIPLPEVINVTTNHTDSCANSNTGTASVVSVNGNTSFVGYTCAWQNTDSSSIISYNSVNACEQIGIPGGTELIVTVSSIIGCTGTSVVKINQRPPIVIKQLFRTTTGQLDQRPCIDVANLTVSGGVYGPNYTVFLIDDVTGANITYFNYSIRMTKVCRSIQYIVGVRDGDGKCIQTFISKDPLVGFGDSIVNPNITLPMGLPPPSPPKGGAFGLDDTYTNQPATVKVHKVEPARTELFPVWILVSVMGVCIIIFLSLFCCQTRKKNETRR